MIKLGRLSVENFKSFEDLYEIDFRSTDLFILDGPNGFGKTTIFDAIELCITGEIGRIISTDNKQKNTHLLKYNLDKPTNIFLELIDDNSTILVIHASIPKDTTQDNNKPKNCKADLKFLAAWPEEGVDLLDINSTNDIFLEDIFNNNNINKTFDIFNYIQQEETFHFLKQKESERHDKISYLFGTNSQTNDKENLLKIKDKINKELGGINENIKNLELDKEKLEKELIPQVDSRIAGDIEPSGKIEIIDSNINISSEIEKHKNNINELNWIIKNPFLYGRLKFNHDINYILLNRKKQILDMINSGHIENYDVVYKVEKHVRWINSLKIQLKKHKNIFLNNIESKDINNIDELSKIHPKIAFNYKSEIESYKFLKNKIKGYQDVLGKIINFRSSLRSHYEMHLNFEDSVSKCPFCGDMKSSISELWASYDKQTYFFEGLKDDSLRELNIIIEKLEKSFIVECKNKSAYIIERYDKFTELLPALNEQLISKDDWLSMNKLKLWFKKSNIDINQLIKINGYELVDNNFSSKLDSFMLYLKNLIGPSESNKNYSDLLSVINEYDIIEDNGALINKFGNKIEAIDLDKDFIFLNFQYLKSKSVLLNKNSTDISKLKAQYSCLYKKFILVRDIYNKYNSIIKNYELNVAKQIAIPFHVYSSKILQTRPDGNGAYLKSAENVRESGYIRFVSNLADEHDAWNTMSSGQLSGVILSFTLAMNKVYPNKFNTLLIDDPVQTMDEINLASFVQLLRNEFLDYQVVISTHERQTSSYFSYKYQFNNVVKVLNLKKERLVI